MMKIPKAEGEEKKSCSFLLHSMSHTRTLLFGYTLPGSHFYFASSFAALGLCNHTSRSITTLPWTLPKGQTTILIPTLGRAPCEGSGIHLLDDINLPWKDNVEQTALEEYAQTFTQNLKKQSFRQTLKHCQLSWNPFFWSISRPQVCNIKLSLMTSTAHTWLTGCPFEALNWATLLQTMAVVMAILSFILIWSSPCPSCICSLALSQNPHTWQSIADCRAWLEEDPCDAYQLR